MKIQLPFIYAAEAVVGKKRNPQTLNYLGIVEADIREITSDMAPVAMSWASANSANRLHEVRTFDGGFFVPAAKLQRDAEKFPASALASGSKVDEDATRGIAVMLGYPLADKKWHDLANFTGSSANSAPLTSEIKSLVSSQEDIERSKAEEAASGLVSIDGILFRQVEEPVIAVSNHLHRGTPTVTVSVHLGSRRYGKPIDLDESITVSDPLNTKFLPLTEMGRAIDLAGYFGVPVDIQIEGEPEIHIPVVFTFDAEFDAALRTAEYSFEGLKHGISKFDRETIETWLHVRESYWEFLKNGDRSIIEDLASDALPRLSERFGALDTKALDHKAAAALEAGLGDWGEGTISVSFGDSLKR
jgi:hypothetical protein